VAVLEVGEDGHQVKRNGGGVESHVEDAGGEGKPGDLEAPKAAKGAVGPDVEASLVGDGRGELADHQGCGDAPKKGDEGEEKQRAAEAGHADDVLEAVGAAGDHEVDGRDERKETEAGGFGLADAGDRSISFEGVLMWKLTREGNRYARRRRQITLV